MNRRGFIAGILAAGAAPWVCTKAGVLMPVRQIVVPDQTMTATEVLERQREYLTKMAALIHAELLINPPLVVDIFGRATQMRIPKEPFFTLTVQDPDPRVRARVFKGRP